MVRWFHGFYRLNVKTMKRSSDLRFNPVRFSKPDRILSALLTIEQCNHETEQ
jgi:hypothetical protein